MGPLASTYFGLPLLLKVINDDLTPRKVAGKKILISEATIRADLLFDDENGVDCFPKQVIWDVLRDIGYEGTLAPLTFSKRHLVHSGSTCHITTLTPSMLEVVSALAAEEEQSTIPISKGCRLQQVMPKGTPTQSCCSLLKVLLSTRNCFPSKPLVKHHALWVRESKPKKQKRSKKSTKKKSVYSQLGMNKDEEKVKTKKLILRKKEASNVEESEPE
ncbi:hypothetical protein Tco_0332281 [Tanacetum coccineum]